MSGRPFTGSSKVGRPEKDIVHIDGGSYMGRRGKDLGYYGDGGASSKVLIAWNGNSGASGQSQESGQSPLDRRNPGILFDEESNQKTFSRYLLPIPVSPGNLLFHGVGLASCAAVLPRNGDWPCAKRGDDQTYAFPNSLLMGPMENRIQILGNKSRSIAGVIAAQTFHIDMNLNPARLAAIP